MIVKQRFPLLHFVLGPIAAGPETAHTNATGKQAYSPQLHKCFFRLLQKKISSLFAPIYNQVMSFCPQLCKVNSKKCPGKLRLYTTAPPLWQSDVSDVPYIFSQF
jgi:hypothetical protein